jgi:hypothetical protein
MKKVFAIVLIACIAFGVAFAAKSADLKVGAQLGYGGMSLKMADAEAPSSNYIQVSLGGFEFAGTAEYQIADAVSLKAELGMNLFGKAKTVMCIAGHKSDPSEADSSTGPNFIIYLGAQYNLELSKEINLGVGAGFDVLMGKLDSEDSDSFNAAMGLGAEVVGSYAIDKNISINLGGKFAWHFINTNEDIKNASGSDTRITNLAYQIFAGATYAL